jgi:hypothetical protein
MADKPPQYPAGIEQLRGDLREAIANLSGRINVASGKIEDMRGALATLPREVTDAIRAERGIVSGRLQRGEDHFDEIFRRIGRMEKQILVMLVLVTVIGLGEAGKVIAWLAPIVRGIIP